MHSASRVSSTIHSHGISILSRASVSWRLTRFVSIFFIDSMRP